MNNDEERIKKYMSDFDEYLRQGEPDCREKAHVWKTSIGLQAVDQLNPSAFLIEKAQQHIEGGVSIEEVQRQVRTYYQHKTARTPDDEETAEADKVSVNIAHLLSTQAFSFSTFGFLQTHRNIFDGVFSHAGKIRTYDISKKEWVLRGDTVCYMYAADLRSAIDYDIEQEKAFNYGGLTAEEIVSHICRFVADLWQIHPFCEGNTRTTAVFTIQYLRSLGFSVDNDIFADNSWYFRNALVRYIYKNRDGVQPETKYLERFFRNFLLGEHHELHNRYMLIHPPKEWMKEDEKTDTAPYKHPTSTPQVPHKLPASTPQAAGELSTIDSPTPRKPSADVPQAADKFVCDNPNVRSLVPVMKEEEWSAAGLLSAMKLKDRKSFLALYLVPAMSEGFVRMRYPDSPHHPRQRYLLTVKGLGLLAELTQTAKTRKS